ncbi:Fe3+-hydroxamate ABC transporter substrate-binding protein [Geobacillus thermocatenulatus]|uniref:Fe3+-hydroxamate ABC transporter substrate-binding protein n=1 Tax=Geobacillus thermocatenulatus TaxID=33938 RepID=A0A226QCF1_9BACL|nr:MULTISPECIES: ABC transporter substrate-binding protein [Geobacillus]ASS98439.1 Fe3+-hydroxamate ABC transporter substrate-binding protein [Geobacillus thermocatenulatus]KLR74144.1 Fe3+-hydroxamate ABC transporter substrate-binding protein [Geobacillus sp. T6]OXB89190.1 Fe3+-hydroxamate ABC transporter substrate-binding protein [Geobacillus thermocatenulatus]
MRRVLAWILSLCLLIAGGLAASVPTGEAASSSITVKDLAGRVVKFASVPKRVVVLGSGDLNTLQALGVSVVGRPTTTVPVSDELKKIPEVGNIHQPNFEKIVSLKPDVLIAGTSFQGYLQKADSLGLKVVLTSGNSVDDIKDSISLLGKLFDKESKAKTIISKIDKKVKKYSGAKTKVRALIVFGAGSTALVALPNSYAGDVLKKAGGENVAADFPKIKEYPGYASLSSERIVASDPDVIFVITHGNKSETKKALIKVMSTSSWKNLRAVKNKRVVFLPNELFAASPGVKVGQALDYLNKELLKVKAKKR